MKAVVNKSQTAVFSEAAKGVLFSTIPFANLRGNAMRTFLRKSDFYWPLMVLAEQWQCSLYANVLSVQSSVPTMFLQFLQTDGLQTDGSAFPIFCGRIFSPRFSLRFSLHFSPRLARPCKLSCQGISIHVTTRWLCQMSV